MTQPNLNFIFKIYLLAYNINHPFVSIFKITRIFFLSLVFPHELTWARTKLPQETQRPGEHSHASPFLAHQNCFSLKAKYISWPFIYSISRLCKIIFAKNVCSSKDTNKKWRGVGKMAQQVKALAAELASSWGRGESAPASCPQTAISHCTNTRTHTLVQKDTRGIKEWRE